MIFRKWTHEKFVADGYERAYHNLSNYEKCGIPLYSSTESGWVYVPTWGYTMYFRLSGVNDESTRIARLSAAAIRSDDPDAFVESVLAAYALGGWRAALALAGAQDEAHVRPA